MVICKPRDYEVKTHFNTENEKKKKKKKSNASDLPRQTWVELKRLRSGVRHFNTDYVEMGVYPRAQPAAAEQTSRQQIASSPSVPSIVHQMVSMA